MKLLIIGLGSIGKRHVRVLKGLCNPEFLYYPSTPIPRADQFILENEITVYPDLQACLNQDPSAAIISNPTSEHISVAAELIKYQIPFLIEKPVSNNTERLASLTAQIEESNLPVLVGFQLRHHTLFQTLLNKVQSGIIGQPLSLVGYVGQYLPEWRPGVDYRKTSSASQTTGGGVLWDLCHEIDLAITIMGPVHSVTCALKKISDLEIDTDDSADIILHHHDNCCSNIHLNYLDRKYSWYTRVIGSEGTILWDYTQGLLEIFRLDQLEPEVFYDPTGFTRDKLFELQALHWLAVLEGRERPLVPFSDGCEVTRIAVAAQRASQTARSISTEKLDSTLR
jgi:predicted dehydrogenase